MTAAADIVREIRAQLDAPLSPARMANNPRPTDDELRRALERFTQPAELANTRVESFLIDQRLIERHISPRQLVAAKKHGQYAKKLYKQTIYGYFFWRDLHNRILPAVIVDQPRAIAPLSHFVTARITPNKALYYTSVHRDVFPTQDGARWLAEFIGGVS